MRPMQKHRLAFLIVFLIEPSSRKPLSTQVIGHIFNVYCRDLFKAKTFQRLPKHRNSETDLKDEFEVDDIKPAAEFAADLRES